MDRCSKLTSLTARSLILSTKTFCFDCDGVIWHGSTVIPGAFKVLQTLHNMGKGIFFLTNNSTISREDVTKKLANFGYQARKEQVITSAYVAAQHLKNRSFKGKAYIVGMEGIAHELTDIGITHLPLELDGSIVNKTSWDDYTDMDLDSEVNCVVAGLDRTFNYYKLLKAVLYIRQQKECLFIATNDDSTFPARNGRMFPGGGTIIKSIETGCGRVPDVVCGKPNTAMFDVLKESHDVNADTTVMVGDRLNTDIQFGNRCGMKTLFVLTGVDDLEEVERHIKSEDDTRLSMVPHHYLDALANVQSTLDDMVEKGAGES